VNGSESAGERFSRWAKSGVFERILKLSAEDHDNEYMMIDALSALKSEARSDASFP
jgi:hypothetical protein